MTQVDPSRNGPSLAERTEGRPSDGPNGSNGPAEAGAGPNGPAEAGAGPNGLGEAGTGPNGPTDRDSPALGDPVPRAPGALAYDSPRPGWRRRLDLAAAAHRNRNRLVELIRTYPAVPLRRAVAAGGAGWVRHVPAGVRRRLDLDGWMVTSPLRVEIGGGEFPSPGFVHVDADRKSRHLEYVASCWRLPFPDASVQELLAVHVLEHVHPGSIHRTLREWRRILAPGGYAEIHVPDASTILPAYLSAPTHRKWELLLPIFGTTTDPMAPRRGPGSVDRKPAAALLDHHNIIYDFDLLRHVLLRAGFDRVEDVSETVSDRHTEMWRDSDLVTRISLVVRAFAA